MHLLYVSILYGSFALFLPNARGMEVISCGKLAGEGSQVSLTVASLICIFWSLVSHFPLDKNRIDSLWVRSGVFLGQSSTPTPWSFKPTFGALQCGQVPNPAGKWNSIFKKLVSIRKHWMKCSKKNKKCIVKGVQWRWFFRKITIGPTPADDIAPQIITDCGNLTLGLQATWAMSFSPFFQTLDLGFQMKYKNLLSSEKRTLDHWATVQFFSLAQVRHLWRQL